jgi:hypothetical protein
VALVAKSEANRAATCPHSEALTTVKSETT